MTKIPRPKSNVRQRHKTVTVRVTPAEHAEFHAFAADQDVSVGELVRARTLRPKCVHADRLRLALSVLGHLEVQSETAAHLAAILRGEDGL